MNLSSEEINVLKAQHRKEQNGKIRDRIKAVLLVNQGYSYEQVAEILLLDDSTIRRHVEEYLKSRKLAANYKGSTSKLNQQQSIELIEYLKSNTFMSVKPILNHIELKYQIKYTKSGITAWLNQHCFTNKKPHPVPAKYNELKQKEFIERLHKLKNEGNPLYFLDATHPEHESKLAYGWIYKGSNKAILTTATQKRIHIFGALSYPEKILNFIEENTIKFSISNYTIRKDKVSA